MAKSLNDLRKNSLGTIPSIEGGTRHSRSFGSSGERTWSREYLQELIDEGAEDD